MFSPEERGASGVQGGETRETGEVQGGGEERGCGGGARRGSRGGRDRTCGDEISFFVHLKTQFR